MTGQKRRCVSAFKKKTLISRKVTSKLRKVFVFTEMCELILHDEFKRKETWETFVQVTQNFLGNHRAERYAELVIAC